MNDDAEAAAFSRLYRDHHRAVLGFALRRVDPQQAQDVVADTFAVAWRRRQEIPQRSLPWLLGVARNVVFEQYRRDGRSRALTSELSRLSELSTVATGDVAAVVTGRMNIFEALTSLSDTDREVLMLTVWDGLDPKGAAIVSGCSTTAFRARLHRARRRMAAALAILDGRENTGAAMQSNDDLPSTPRERKS